MIPNLNLLRVQNADGGWDNYAIPPIHSCGCDGTLADHLPEPAVTIRPAPRERVVGCKVFAIYSTERYYGGPEEGGWWYTEYYLVRRITVPNRLAARARQLLSKFDQYVVLDETLPKIHYRPSRHYC